MDVREIREVEPIQEIEGVLAGASKIKIDPTFSVIAHIEAGTGKPMPHETHEETGDSLYISDFNNKKVITKLPTNIWRIRDIAFNKDGSLLACAGSVVEVWDIQRFKNIISFENFNPGIKKAAFNPTENILMCTSIVPTEKPKRPRPSYGITLLDINKGKAYDVPSTNTEANYEYQLIGFDPQGTFVIGCSLLYNYFETGKIRAWHYHKDWPFRYPKLTTIWTKELCRIDGLVFHPDGKKFFCVSLNRQGMIINQIETKSGKVSEIVRGMKHFIQMNSVNIHPNGKLLVIAGNAFLNHGGIWILDLETSNLQKLSDSNSHFANFSQDGSHLFSIWYNKCQTFGVFPSIT